MLGLPHRMNESIDGPTRLQVVITSWSSAFGVEIITTLSTTESLVLVLAQGILPAIFLFIKTRPVQNNHLRGLKPLTTLILRFGYRMWVEKIFYPLTANSDPSSNTCRVRNDAVEISRESV